MKMLTADQRKIFEVDGLLCIKGAIPQEDVTGMCNRIWTLLERKGLQRDDPETWTIEKPKIQSGWAESGILDPCRSEMVQQAVTDLSPSPNWAFGPRKKMGVLVNFPQAEQWFVPESWHVDGPAGPSHYAWAVSLFYILSPLKPQGGGTLVLAGSHLLVRDLVANIKKDRLPSGQVIRRMARSEPWFDDIRSGESRYDREKLMEGTTTRRGHHVRLVEMTGEPGDVFLMHSWLVHTASPNCSDVPRIVALERPRCVARER